MSVSIERVWTSESYASLGARAALTPLAWLFRLGVSVRNAAYDRKFFSVTPSALPVLSVGNLSVGGTGKTPIAAWFVQQLCERGARPAIVMRGYGNDEPMVHRLLSPNVPVYANVDRVAGIAEAQRGGANVVVLDDGFQHRRAGRYADVVLISADAWPANGTAGMLPAGPMREPMSSLRRASLAIITTKSASADAIARVHSAVRSAAPKLPVAAINLRMNTLVAAWPNLAAGNTVGESLSALAGASVLAIAGVANPTAFFRQLEATGAKVAARQFADHHAFTATDVRDLSRTADAHKYVICTLKDAVKLAPLWPAKARPLWYVSQAIEVIDGLSLVDSLLADIVSEIRP